ncbi:paired amphipathic helix protein Sin3a, partial [Phenoliferia sp. Uapishka_3]
MSQPPPGLLGGQALPRLPNQRPPGSMPSVAAVVAAPSPQSSTPSTNAPSPINAQPPAPPSTAFRPLNVRDALNYLDKVKQQFSTEYEGESRASIGLRSGAIDTPGVIDRVSTLFRGHPSLIQGFNTFLPPGYRIECHVSTGDEEGARNTITVTTPMGVTTRTQDVNGHEAREFVRNQPRSSRPSTGAGMPGGNTANGLAQRSNGMGSASPIPPPAGTTQGQHSKVPRDERASSRDVDTKPVVPNSSFVPSQSSTGPSSTAFDSYPPGSTSAASNVPRSRPASTSYWPNIKQPLPGQPKPLSRPLPSSNTSKPSPQPPTVAPPPKTTTPIPTEPESDAAADAADTIVAAASGATGSDAPTPVMMEFNHAISYVNKIKNRFTKEPETYKTFLEILQTYQKETRPIQEVYTQVTELFQSAPDLLDEFKAFLPDTNDPNAAALAAQRRKADASGGIGGAGKSSANMASTMKKGPLIEEKKKRAAPGMGERAKAKRAKTHHTVHAESPPPQPQPQPAAKMDRDRSGNLSNLSNEPPPPQLPYHPQPYGAPPPGFPGAPRMQSAYDAYLQNHRTPTLVQADEFGFFDRVKKHLDDKLAYTDFLKLLNLFTQEIIDVATLLEKSLLFIGGSDELVHQFKNLVGWDPVKDGRIEGEDWIIDNEPVLDRPLVELYTMKKFGPSYRKLPDSEIDLACSGRDALEWSVLNDDWVAFATWASEGSGAHRKNMYEDALYNSEQERHWYSFQIEANLRTISHLEPLAARIVEMSPDERATFRLEGGLGGSSPSVCERVIRKIYGKDQGWEIIAALCDNPVVAVPIVLSRLKQKDEEWKRAEREWNKVWREVDAKNFYRSLDHQGVTFKQTDKKATTTQKSLTLEIEALKRDGLQKRLNMSAPTPIRPLHQQEFGMPDRDVLFDILKLTFSFLDRNQGGYSVPERIRVEAFLRLFVPLLFGVPHSDMEANLAHSDETHEHEEEELDSEVEASSDHETNGGEAHEGGSMYNGKKNGHSKKGGAADLRKRVLAHAATTAARSSQAKASSRANSPTEERKSTTPVGVLGEQTWIHLTESKETGMDSDEPLPERRFNFFANATFYCLARVIFTLYHRLSDFKIEMNKLAVMHYQRLSPLAIDLGLTTPVPVIDAGDNPAEHYYAHTLDLSEKLFDGEISQADFEEHLRYMGGIHAYPLFTIDKLVSGVIKHIHTINGDQKCQDLVTLLEKDRAREYTTPRQQIAYRMEAESTIGADESLYRLEWVPDVQALTIQLLGKEDLTLDDAHGSNGKMHSSWVASFALTSATEGIGAHVKAPLLKRNRMLSASEDPQEFDLTTGLEAKVAEDSYQLAFVANTEDFLHRRRPATDSVDPPVDAVAAQRQKRFNTWLETASSRGTADVDASMAEV